MTTKRTLLTLLCLALLNGCGSSPRSDYYMLTADAQGAPGNGGPSLGVGPVTVPEYLNTRQIIMNRNQHKLKLAEFDRWAEPLDAGVSRVVAVNLAVLMNTSNVQTFPWRRDAIPEYAVRIAVIQFAAQGKEALLVAEWAISRPGQGQSGGRGISQLTTTLKGGEPEHVAGAYSELLLEMSEIIAEAMRKDIEAQAAAGS
jgi:uncharacterized lipoprotein YmbA